MAETAKPKTLTLWLRKILLLTVLEISVLGGSTNSGRAKAESKQELGPSWDWRTYSRLVILEQIMLIYGKSGLQNGLFSVFVLFCFLLVVFYCIF